MICIECSLLSSKNQTPKRGELDDSMHSTISECPYCLLQKVRSEAASKGTVITIGHAKHSKTNRRAHGVDVKEDGILVCRFKKFPTICTCKAK
jgi:hypothetical protein